MVNQFDKYTQVSSKCELLKITVIPAKAGNHLCNGGMPGQAWIPAFAGMTVVGFKKTSILKLIGYIELLETRDMKDLFNFHLVDSQ